MSFEATTTWLQRAGRLYVAADDLIALLRAGDYHALADDFERVAADEASRRAGAKAPLTEMGEPVVGSPVR